MFLSTEHDGEILFTYDVLWDITTMPWTQRWVNQASSLASRLVMSVK